jgi:hypothetical protein
LITVTLWIVSNSTISRAFSGPDVFRAIRAAAFLENILEDLSIGFRQSLPDPGGRQGDQAVRQMEPVKEINGFTSWNFFAKIVGRGFSCPSTVPFCSAR